MCGFLGVVSVINLEIWHLKYAIVFISWWCKNAVLIIITLKPWLFEKTFRTILGIVADIDLVKLVGYAAPSKKHRETQTSFWTFVRHNYFMKNISNKGHGKCTYKGWIEGTVTLAWMPRGLLGCTGDLSTYNVTNKVHQNTLLHSLKEEFYNKFGDFNHDY